MSKPVEITHRPGPMAWHLDTIDGMSDAQAKAYLLEMLTHEVTQSRARVAKVIDAIPGIKRRPAQLLLFLGDAMGRTVTIDHLCSRWQIELGFEPSDESVRTAVKHARAALEAAQIPLVIVTEVGVGLRLEAPQSWKMPW